MTSIEQHINEIANKFNLEITKLKQSNKVLSITFKSERVERADEVLYEAMQGLPFIKKYYFGTYQLGKKVDDCGWYNFNMVVTDKYSNGEVDSSKVAGKLLNFIDNNEIITLTDLANSTIRLIHNMSQAAHVETDKTLKKNYRLCKKNYIRFLYENDLIDSIQEQISYCDDILLLFTIGDSSFHLRKHNVHFIKDYGNEVTIKDEIYEKKIIIEEKIDFEFLKYFKLLNNLHQNRIFDVTDIEVATWEYITSSYCWEEKAYTKMGWIEQ